MFGEEKRRAAEISRSVLPWACLTPDIAVRRLLQDWALHRRQVRASQIVVFVNRWWKLMRTHLETIEIMQSLSQYASLNILVTSPQASHVKKFRFPLTFGYLEDAIIPKTHLPSASG